MDPSRELSIGRAVPRAEIAAVVAERQTAARLVDYSARIGEVVLVADNVESLQRRIARGKDVERSEASLAVNGPLLARQMGEIDAAAGPRALQSVLDATVDATAEERVGMAFRAAGVILSTSELEAVATALQPYMNVDDETRLRTALSLAVGFQLQNGEVLSIDQGAAFFQSPDFARRVDRAVRLSDPVERERLIGEIPRVGVEEGDVDIDDGEFESPSKRQQITRSETHIHSILIPELVTKICACLPPQALLKLLLTGKPMARMVAGVMSDHTFAFRHLITPLNGISATPFDPPRIAESTTAATEAELRGDLPIDLPYRHTTHRHANVAAIPRDVSLRLMPRVYLAAVIALEGYGHQSVVAKGKAEGAMVGRAGSVKYLSYMSMAGSKEQDMDILRRATMDALGMPRLDAGRRANLAVCAFMTASTRDPPEMLETLLGMSERGELGVDLVRDGYVDEAFVVSMRSPASVGCARTLVGLASRQALSAALMKTPATDLDAERLGLVFARRGDDGDGVSFTHEARWLVQSLRYQLAEADPAVMASLIAQLGSPETWDVWTRRIVAAYESHQSFDF